MYRSYFLTCHEFHQPKFELALQGHCVSLPETMTKGLRKLLCACQRHPNSIAVGSHSSLTAAGATASPWAARDRVLPPCFTGMSWFPTHCIQLHQLGQGGLKNRGSVNSCKNCSHSGGKQNKTKQHQNNNNKKIHKQNSLYFAETLKKLKTSCL